MHLAEGLSFLEVEGKMQTSVVELLIVIRRRGQELHKEELKARRPSTDLWGQTNSRRAGVRMRSHPKPNVNLSISTWVPIICLLGRRIIVETSALGTLRASPYFLCLPSGLEKKDAVMSEQKKKLVAYHEAQYDIT